MSRFQFRRSWMVIPCLFGVLTTSALADEFAPPDLGEPRFSGTVSGEVKWAHDTNWFFMFEVEEVRPAEGLENPERFEAYKKLPKGLKIGIKWDGPNKPNPEQEAFWKSLKPGQEYTLELAPGYDNDPAGVRLAAVPGGDAEPEHAPEPDEAPEPSAVKPADRVKGGPIDPPSANGAQVDESAIRVTLHVNQATGDDINDGSEGKPFATIAAGLNAAMPHLAKGEATKVRIAAGIYREGDIKLDFSEGQAHNTLLVIEGEDASTTILTGADRWTADKWEHLGDGLFVADWPHDWGHFTYNWGPPKPLGHRREAVHLDGHVMKQRAIERYDYEVPGGLFTNNKQVHTYRGFADPATTLRPGEYGVAERNENGNKLYIRLADPDAINTAVIEVAQRRQLLILGEKDGIVLRNLTFTQAANDFTDYGKSNALTMAKDTRNLLIDRCRFTWNNFFGLSTQGQGITVRDTVVNYNGYGGIGGTGDDVVFDRCTTNFNNWRGHWGGHYGWNHAGVKMHETTLFTIREHTAVGNLTGGIWFDIHCHDVRVDDSVSALNHGFGIFFELSNGPFAAERNLLVHNGSMQFRTSIIGDTALRDSVLYGNTTRNDTGGKLRLPTAAISNLWYLRSDPHAMKMWLEPGRLRFERNVVSGGKYQVALFAVQNGIDRSDDRYSMWKLEAHGNFFDAPNNEAYLYNGKNWNWHIVQYPGFAQHFGLSQNQMGQIYFRDPDGLDFRVNDNSPLAGRENLPLKKIDPALLEEAAAWYAWSGLPESKIPVVLRGPTADLLNAAAALGAGGLVDGKAPKVVAAGETVR